MVTIPDASPVTTPNPLTVAIAGLLLLHTPPVGVPDNVIADPLHTSQAPVIVCPFDKTGSNNIHNIYISFRRILLSLNNTDIIE
jgi:hypothetical protein